MANFNTHISVAFVASGVAALVIYKAGMVSGSEYLLCVIAGTLGGLLPDIDLENSVPARIGFNVLSLLIAFGMVIYWSSRLSLMTLAIVWLLTYVIMRYGVFNLFSSLTVHRGIVHSLPYLGILALGVVYASFYGMKFGATVSWFLGAFVFFGAVIHLILDEVYSVNVFGLKLKKSFGTALKVFDTSQPWQYAGLYAGVIAMLVFAPPFEIFWKTLTDPISWLILQKNLLPNGISVPTF